MSRPPEHPAKAPVAHVTSKAPALALKPSDFATPRSPHAAADLRGRMYVWARGVVARLGGAGVRVAAMSGESPGAASPDDGLRVDFVAGAVGASGAARGVAPVCLTFGIDGAGVRAGLELPAGHARAARVVLGDPARALQVSSALHELPEQFVMGLAGDSGASGEGAAVAAQSGTAADVRALLDVLEGGTAPGLWIGWRIPRDLAIEHAELLDEQLQDALAALAQLFAVLAAIPPDGAAEGEGRARRPGDRDRKAPRKRGDDERDRPAAKRGRGGAARERAAARETAHEPARPVRADREGEPASQRRADPEPPGVAAPRRRGLAELKTPPRPGLRPRPAPGDASSAIERGTRVEVLKGPFSGKVGVVQELDGKGGARVMLGLLAVRVDVTHLVVSPAGRPRPVLSSSHRKPLSARS